MKKLLLIATISTVLTACTGGNYHRDIASINAERNSTQAMVTDASLAQARKQRQNQLEEAILLRQQDAMANQSRRESSSVVTDTLKNTLGVIFK